MIAFTREVSPAIGRCELTHMGRVPIDATRAQHQHKAFEDALRQLGCRVRRLPAAPALPDGVFVQDIAVVLDEVAIIAQPGAESRRAEISSVADALGPVRALEIIESPGTLDGGDVLPIGRTIYIGRSQRTNEEGIRQFAAAVRPHGYEVREVKLKGCLHLQSAATVVADRTLLINPHWIDPSVFAEYRLIEIDPSEPFAANALRVNNAILYPSAFPRTQAKLQARGITVIPLDLSELAKAEGGVTCCCILVPAPIVDTKST
jgi:dimethylargininase